mgnify:CR=1 FL=1
MELRNKLGLADIHTHILPDFDDGAASVEEAIEMLREEINQGITDVVLTPHFNLANESVEEFLARRKKSFDLLSKKLKKSKINVNIHLGAEVRYYPSLINDDIFNLCIGDTSYLLLELASSYPLNFEQTINWMMSRGVTPILAHIERYEYLYSNKKLMLELLDSGVLFQCNASSLLKFHTAKKVKKLLKQGIVHILASDTHNLTNRSPVLVQGLNKVTKFADILISNAQSVIKNELI